jgi:hypothetical protein
MKKVDYYFNTEKERDKWLMKNALEQIESDVNSIYSNSKNPRSLEEALEIARNQLNHRVKCALGKNVTPKEFQIKKRIHKHLVSGPYENSYSIVNTKQNDTFISNVSVTSKDYQLNILYQGHPENVSLELIDELLCCGDSSENPLRPFRWYRNNDKMDCVSTDVEGEVEKGARRALDTFIIEFKKEPEDKIEYICIYEIL